MDRKPTPTSTIIWIVVAVLLAMGCCLSAPIILGLAIPAVQKVNEVD